MKGTTTVVRTNPDGSLTHVELKPYRALPLPRGLTPLSVPKRAKVLVRAGVVVPPKFEEQTGDVVLVRDRVAVCVGLKRAVRGCWWEVVSVHERGETHRAEAAARETCGNLGVALFLLDDDKLDLIDEKGKKI
jgi:hypothetical protein